MSRGLDDDVCLVVLTGTFSHALRSAEAIVQCRLLPGDTIDSARQALVQAVGDAKVEIAATKPWGAGKPMAAGGRRARSHSACCSSGLG